MYRPSEESPQANLFTSAGALFTGKSLSLYEDSTAWHNQFCKHVTMRIDEGSVLFLIQFGERHSKRLNTGVDRHDGTQRSRGE